MDCRPAHSDFIVELRRLHERLLEAMKQDDPPAIEAAVDDMALFLRYNAVGRLPEYFARDRSDREGRHDR